MANCCIHCPNSKTVRFICDTRKAHALRPSGCVEAPVNAAAHSDLKSSPVCAQARLGRFDLFTAPRPAYELVGLGEAMVDYSGMVTQEYLEDKNVRVGGRRVINVQERAEIIEELEAQGFQLNAGGSLANTLTGCAVLARAAHDMNPDGVPEASIGMAGMIGDDHLGGFFQQQLLSSGVKWLGMPSPGSATGTVLVLTTPDAQRSFLSLPSASGVSLCSAVVGGMASARMLVIEGYLWEMPSAQQVIRQAIALARAAGAVVAMTAADVSVVRKHRNGMLEAVRASDVIFTNAEEARELVGDGLEAANGAHVHDDSASIAHSRPRTAEADAMQLGRICPTSVVTDGSRGSYIAALGQVHVVPPHWAKDAPVDTCGAGDAYAAGFLHAYLRGLSVRQMGEFAAATASSVISHQGPDMRYDDARTLVASLDACCHLEGQSYAERW